jgi:putative ABC transport system permease protein
VDSWVLGFTLVVCLLAALAFGLAPALQFTSPDPGDTLKAEGRTPAGGMRHGLRQALVAAEITLALVLLVGAGLLVRSFVQLLNVDRGFSVERVLALEVHVWGLARKAAQRAAFFEETLDRLAALPGVEAAAAVSGLPFHPNPISPNTAFTIEGRPAPAPGQEPAASVNTVTADYFSVMGIPLRRGRLFTRFDRSDRPPVALINETMARRHWPGEDPVGAKVVVELFGQRLAAEVVGVVGNVRQDGLDTEPRPELFLPHLQQPYGSMTFVVRTAGDPAGWLTAVKREIWAVNGSLPFSSTWTLEQLVARSVAERRLVLALVGAFAVVALLMAAVGIYGLISVAARQRTHEIGVRMALGARSSDVLRLVLRQALVVTVIGVATGVVGALAFTRYLAGLLYAVTAVDPLTYSVVAAFFVAGAMLASYVPARRATRVAAVVALRGE